MDQSSRHGGKQSVLANAGAEIRFTAENKRVLLVHGSPRKMNEYLFEDRPLSSFQRLAASSNADIIVFGHTHKPYVKAVDAVTFLNVGISRKTEGRRLARLLCGA